MIGVFTFKFMDKNFVQLLIRYKRPEDAEIIIAILSEEGYMGFEEKNDRNELLAFIGDEHYNESKIKDLSSQYNFECQKTILPETNWNKEWESNFHPITINDYCGIRAAFHEPLKNVKHEIIITPKMSFGTGHHATTYMMIESMKDVDVKNKTVFDFGTGTGVLAILAEKEGASEILAMDHDEWSVMNAEENKLLNHAKRITIIQNDDPACGRQFDIILANINKHIIIETLPTLASQLNPGGIIICSGFMKQDVSDINAKATKCKLLLKQTMERENWVCSIFQLS